MQYASLDDLKEYMGKSTFESETSENIKQMLLRANEIIEIATVKNYVSSDALHVSMTKKAACAQTQYWIENGQSPLSDAPISSYSLGDMSMTMASSQGQGRPGISLCSMSLYYLRSARLLYRGLRTVVEDQ